MRGGASRPSFRGSRGARNLFFFAFIFFCGTLLLIMNASSILQPSSHQNSASMKSGGAGGDDVDNDGDSDSDYMLGLTDDDNSAAGGQGDADDDDVHRIDFNDDHSKHWSENYKKNKNKAPATKTEGASVDDNGNDQPPEVELTESTVRKHGHAFTWNDDSSLTLDGALSIMGRVLTSLKQTKNGKNIVVASRRSGSSASTSLKAGGGGGGGGGAAVTIPTVDAIVVLCGGGHLPLWVKERFQAAKLLHDASYDHATMLDARNIYHKKLSQDQQRYVSVDQIARRLHDGFHGQRSGSQLSVEADIILQGLHLEPVHRNDTRLPTIAISGGGSPHVGPVLVEENGVQHTVHEATEGCAYLRNVLNFKGTLMKETSSYDTLGNAFFIRQLFAAPQEWSSAVVLTSDWHMKRSILLFEYIFSLLPKLPTKLFFVSTPPGATEKSVELRSHVEERSLEKMKSMLLGDATHHLDRQRGTVQQTLKEFQQWMLLHHTCYDEKGPRETALRKKGDENALY